MTSPGGTASGRIVFEGASKPPVAPTALNVFAVPLDMSMMMMSGGAVRVKDDWTFESSGLFERRRFRVNAPPSGWFLKAVMHEGTDITDSGLEFKEGQQIGGIEIVLTQRAAEIAGSVQDAQARPVSDYAVVAFAADNTKWGFQTRFIRSTRPNQEGRFSMKGCRRRITWSSRWSISRPEKRAIPSSSKMEEHGDAGVGEGRRTEGSFSEAHPVIYG